MPRIIIQLKRTKLSRAIVLNKVFILDVDGILNYYPSDFMEWCKLHYGIQGEQFESIKALDAYKDFKLEYRKSGDKIKQKLRKGVPELLNWLRKNKWLVWVVTSRPDVLSNHRVTIEWLALNNVDYDRIFFCDHKFAALEDYISEEIEILAMLDDQPKFLNNVAIEVGLRFNRIRFCGFCLTNELYGESSHHSNINSIEQVVEGLNDFN